MYNYSWNEVGKVSHLPVLKPVSSLHIMSPPLCIPKPLHTHSQILVEDWIEACEDGGSDVHTILLTFAGRVVWWTCIFLLLYTAISFNPLRIKSARLWASLHYAVGHTKPSLSLLVPAHVVINTEPINLKRSSAPTWPGIEDGGKTPHWFNTVRGITDC